MTETVWKAHNDGGVLVAAADTPRRRRLPLAFAPCCLPPLPPTASLCLIRAPLYTIRICDQRRDPANARLHDRPLPAAAHQTRPQGSLLSARLHSTAPRRVPAHVIPTAHAVALRLFAGRPMPVRGSHRTELLCGAGWRRGPANGLAAAPSTTRSTGVRRPRTNRPHGPPFQDTFLPHDTRAAVKSRAAGGGTPPALVSARGSSTAATLRPRHRATAARALHKGHSDPRR
jgi:hypothetical protein